MARTRSLVTGYLERISVKALEEYHAEITELAKAEHGVYALYKKDRLYYVGLAIDLRRRIDQHMKDKHAEKWNRFSLYLVRKVDHIREIESLLLRIADPKGNKHAGRLKHAQNLQRRLKSSMIRRRRAEILAMFSATRPMPSDKRRSRRKTAGANDQAKSSEAAQILRQTEAAGKAIFASYQGWEYRARVLRNGTIKFGGKSYESPSAAGRAITKRPLNGWAFWWIRQGGEKIRLGRLRREVI